MPLKRPESKDGTLAAMLKKAHRGLGLEFHPRPQANLVPRAMPVRGLGLALALGKRNADSQFHWLP